MTDHEKTALLQGTLDMLILKAVPASAWLRHRAGSSRLAMTC